MQWSVILGEHDIAYEIRRAIKAQVLADFLQEMTIPDISNKETEEWRMFIDGATGKNGSGVGIILIGPKRIRIEYAVRMGYHATNNAAEYEALVIGLRLANEVKAKNLKILCDSQLVVNQLKGDFVTKDTNMSKYLEKACELLQQLEEQGGH